MAKDPIQEKADKLDKETQETQAKQKAEFEKPRKNMPGEPDMGPSVKKGIEEGLTKGMGGKALGMKKGGKIGSASKRADGCCTKGKTKGRIC
jgi:hypothetical protein